MPRSTSQFREWHGDANTIILGPQGKAVDARARDFGADEPRPPEPKKQHGFSTRISMGFRPRALQSSHVVASQDVLGERAPGSRVNASRPARTP